MRFGVLTGGGDCPGLNAVIRGAVRRAAVGGPDSPGGDEVIGFLDGWTGVMENRWEQLDVERCRGILPRGGTILGTSRDQPYRHADGVERVKATQRDLGIDAFIVIGGDGTLSAARELHGDGVPVVGVPKTIDNDIGATELTFGFDTAVHIASTAIDRLHTTAESHDRVIVCEVMGRHVGHIATHAGIAGGATMVLVPEHPFNIAEVCDALVRRHDRGKWASIVVVAEGAIPAEGTLEKPTYDDDDFGHARLGGISHVIAGEIERRTGFEARVTILGHVQRGGTPTAFDRVLATRFGVAATDAARDGALGQMVALQCGAIVRVGLEEATAAPKFVSEEIYDVARCFFA